MYLRACAAAVVLIFIQSAAYSQETTGSLQGRTVTEAGDPLAAVRVTITSSSLQGVRTVETDPQGFFRFASLPVGRYIVEFTGIGYRAVVVDGVPIQLGRATPLETVVLEAQAIELSPIIVTAAPVVIDVTTTTVGATLDASTIADLPTERNYRAIVAFLPHANQSFYGDEVNVGGATGLENMYVIDGVNVTAPYKATGGTNLPYNLIKEIEVKEGGYEAEYGKAMGGIINVITHTGSNRWEFDGFGYITNDALATQRKPGLLDLPQRSGSTYDVGLRVSGPILRDRVWISAAYNPSFDRREIEALNQGFFQERRTEHRFATKFTWRAAERLDVEASVLGDPATHHHVGPLNSGAAVVELLNPDPYLWQTDEGGVALSLNGRYAMGRRLVLEATVARSVGDDDMRGRTEQGRTDSRMMDYPANTAEGGVGWYYDTHMSRASVELKSTLFLGNHTVKIGGAYEENRVDHYATTPELGFIGKSGDSVYSTDAFTYDSDGRRNRVPTVYVQDSWRLSDRLRVNAGIRWDGQYLIGDGDSVAQAFTKQWQPRLGFVFQPGRLGTQKVFGSYGRFYQQEPLHAVAMYLSAMDEVIRGYSADPRESGVEPVWEMAGPWPIPQKVQGAHGHHFDEFTLGYERAVGRQVRLVVRGIHRTLRNGWTVALDSLWDYVAGNPGEGVLSFLPQVKREYTALELTFERRGVGPLSFLVSYVLSRSYGNYTGLFSSDTGWDGPGNNSMFSHAGQGPNSEGLLPNDRTHVLKVAGSYKFDLGLSAGTFFTWQSGTPLNEFGPSEFSAFRRAFLVPRGSAGRTPAIWDLNVRLAYLLGRGLRLPVQGRIVLDLLHIGSPSKVVLTNQVRYVGPDPDTQIPNPNFGAALAYQPPFTVRLGLELGY
jgi:hypothetical protein